jgi:hypothetical protein
MLIRLVFHNAYQQFINTRVDLDLLEDSASLLGLSSEKLHAKCQQQLDDLREEYERYKLRAQSILKTKGNKPAVSIRFRTVRDWSVCLHVFNIDK